MKKPTTFFQLKSIVQNLHYLFLLWLLFMLLDAPFYMYCIAVNVWILFQNDWWRYTTKNMIINLTGRLILVTISFQLYYSIISNFEIINEKNYNFTIETLNSSAIFYRINDPTYEYNKKIDTIQKYMNRNISKGTSKLISLNVSNVNIWSSDTLRYDFLLRYWNSHTKIRAPYACLMESDFTINSNYIQNKLIENKPDIAYVQHFWGHSTFEPYNIGLLCASKTASLTTRLWVRLMYCLYSKRYRRLLILGPLFSLPFNKYVFEWDRDKGCTDLYPHCNYIHFTRPKIVGIEIALNKIFLNKFQ